MNRSRLTALAFAVVAVLHAADSSAQTFALEVRGGLALPTGEWFDVTDVASGWGSGLTGIVSLAPGVESYGGLEKHWMDAGVNTFALRLGLQAPLSDSGIRLVAGAVRLDLEASEGSAVAEAGWGLELGIGYDLPMRRYGRISPQVRYRRNRLDYGAGSIELPVVLVDVGYAIGF